MNPAKPGIQIHINRLHLSALKQSPHQIFCQTLATGMKQIRISNLEQPLVETNDGVL
jgi:hypothetical protein